MKVCKIEGCCSPVFSKGMCKFHVPKKRIKSSPHSLRTSTIKYKPKVDKYTKEEREALTALYKRIWAKRSHVSEISEEKLYTPLRTMFHHILSKHKYEELILKEDNVILITPQEHANVELNPTRYEEINRRRELLLNKYNIL